MINYLLKFIFVFIFCSSIILAQESNNSPLIYRLSNSGFRAEPTGKISVIDGLTGQPIATKETLLGIRCTQMELSHDNKKVFIAGNIFPGVNAGGLEVTVNLASDDIITPFLKNLQVGRLKLDPTQNRLWALLFLDNQIILLDPNSLKTIDKIDNIEMPVDIIFNSDGSRAYVALFNNNLLVFDTKTKTLIKTITDLPEPSVFIERPMEMAISANDKILYFGSKNTVSIIDTSSLTVTKKFNFSEKNFDGVVKLLLHPNGKILYIAEIDAGGKLYKYDIQTGNVKQILDLALLDQNTIKDLKITPDGRLLYISDYGGRVLIDSNTDEIIFNIIDSGRNVENFGDIALVGDFSVGQAPIIQTTVPTTNQQLLPNQPFTITWRTTVQPQSFSLASHKIELSTDGGTTFNTIPGAEQLKADAQSFNWQVPNIEVAKAQIRVSTVDIGARRASSTTGNFSISKGGGSTGDTQSPTVNFFSPKGGERFNSGDSLQISWISSDNVGVTSQDLSLSTDGGVTFAVTLASGLSGATQNFTYQIPMSLQSDQTRLRLVVRDAAGNNAQAITLNNFSISLGADTINPTVTISQPSQAQSIIAGQPIQVKWQSTDNRAVVNQALLLSFDGGKTFSQISSFGATDNSFVLSNIDKLNLTTPQAVVKITAIDSTGNKGEANSLFTITPAITMASYQAKVLSVSGIGFMSNVNNTIRLFINDKEVTLPPSSVSNNSFTLKANKKKLGIVKGSNTVRLVIDGVMSNSFSFQF